MIRFCDTNRYCITSDNYTLFIRYGVSTDVYVNCLSPSLSSVMYILVNTSVVRKTVQPQCNLLRQSYVHKNRTLCNVMFVYRDYSTMWV